MLKKSLEKREKYRQKTYYKKFIINIGLPFNMSTKKYPIEPSEETLTVVLEIYKRWQNFSFTHNYEHHLIEKIEDSNWIEINVCKREIQRFFISVWGWWTCCWGDVSLFWDSCQCFFHFCLNCFLNKTIFSERNLPKFYVLLTPILQPNSNHLALFQIEFVCQKWEKMSNFEKTFDKIYLYIKSL